MALSRSDFLKRLAHSGLEILPVFVPILNQPEPQAIQDEEAEREWLEIGSLSEFVPGCAVAVANGNYMLIAHEQGLYAVDQAIYLKGLSSPRRPLRLQAQGKLELNTQKTWPDQACLSILTGNQITEEDVCV